MLAFSWDLLNYNEKLYFQNNQILFLQKKTKLIENSKLNNEMKSLHAKLKLIEEGEEMQGIANKLILLDNKKADNWLEIDKF